MCTSHGNVAEKRVKRLKYNFKKKKKKRTSFDDEMHGCCEITKSSVFKIEQSYDKIIVIDKYR